MNCNPDGSVYEFEEKPKHPKSTLASMGIYIFNWKKLRQYLEEDEANPESENDFGKNIIPSMLGNHEKLYTYAFDGYWKDVGTIGSLWEANMDVLDPKVPLDLSDPTWKIYSRNPGLPPHYVSDTAKIQNSMVTEGCCVEGALEQSILFANVTVEEGAVIDHSIIMPGSVIKKGAKIEYSIVAENVTVEEDAVVGCAPEAFEGERSAWGVAVVASGVHIGKGAVVPSAGMIDKDVPAAGKEAE
jgi:glucose-1-phosphate adenylyltransferase